jgi:TRAP-type C4-dicarboxylate transport system substrate-binding protein
MGAEWKTATDGRVTLRMYPGGVAGDDPDVVRKMRVGQLQAGTLTLTGLTEIDSAFNAFGIPLFFDSYEEYFYVLEKLEPVLKERLASKGYEFLHWGHGGWIHLFSSQPIRTIDQLRREKLFVWAGSDRMVRWWKDNDFRPVPLALTDVVTALQTGMIEAMPNTPLAMLSFQWYRNTPNMLSMGFGPFLGATVVTTAGWNRIAPDDRDAILASAAAAAERFRIEIPVQDSNAVAEMEKRGLTVNEVNDPAAQAGWQEAAEMFAANMRESFVPPDIYDLAFKARAEFRSRTDTESR